jgi:hypothetical protein
VLLLISLGCGPSAAPNNPLIDPCVKYKIAAEAVDSQWSRYDKLVEEYGEAAAKFEIETTKIAAYTDGTVDALRRNGANQADIDKVRSESQKQIDAATKKYGRAMDLALAAVFDQSKKLQNAIADRDSIGVARDN